MEGWGWTAAGGTLCVGPQPSEAEALLDHCAGPGLGQSRRAGQPRARTPPAGATASAGGSSSTGIGPGRGGWRPPACDRAVWEARGGGRRAVRAVRAGGRRVRVHSALGFGAHGVHRVVSSRERMRGQVRRHTEEAARGPRR